jgi:hypothetical protein
MRPVLSDGVNSSWLAVAGRGPVGEEVLQALTTREAIATTTNVRWRRDMGGSGEGKNGWR